MNGVQIGGLSNIVQGQTSGVQIAGIVNKNKKSVIGLQVGGISNFVLDSLQGMQVGGISNLVTGDVNGLQIGGIHNHITKSLNGVQISGITNWVQDSLTGLQIAGISNINQGETHGFQLAGIHNISTKSIRGGQVSGISNQALSQMRGVQISLINYAKINKGLQLGFINVADSTTGLALGLFNYVKNGFHPIEVFTTDIFDFNVAFKSGIDYFYVTYTIGLRPEEPHFFGFGAGIGTKINTYKWLSFSLDLTGTMVHENEELYRELNLVNRLDLTIDFNIKKFSIFLGPSLNYQISKTGYASTGEFTTTLARDPFYVEVIAVSYTHLTLPTTPYV